MDRSSVSQRFYSPEQDLSSPWGWQIGFLEYRKGAQTHGIDGWLSREEQTCLYNLAKRATPGDLIVEIGSYKGLSTVHLAAGARMSNKQAMVFAIDPFCPNVPRDGNSSYRDYFGAFLDTIHRCELGDYITALQGFSRQMVDRLPKEEIDLLFIDGDHSYAGVQEDFDLYFPKVGVDGLVVFHDSDQGAITQFLRDMEKTHPVTRMHFVESITGFFKNEA